MMWFLAVLVVLAMGGVAVVAAGRGRGLVEEYDDRPDALVPADRPLAAEDLRRLRFSLAFRGYRMDEVDSLLGRLATELEQREVGTGDRSAAAGDAPRAEGDDGPADRPGAH